MKPRAALPLCLLLPLALAGCNQVVDGWTIKKVGSPTITRYDDGSIAIANSSAASGAKFKRADLDRNKVYRLEISGTLQSGRPAIGISQDDRPIAHATAPDGKLDLVVSDTTGLEVFISGDHPFSYRTKLVLSECPDCMTDAQLRETIRAAIPGIDDRLNSDLLPAIDLLLQWASAVVDLGSGIPEFANVYGSVSLMSAAQIYSDVWLKDAGGTSCAGFAVFFQKVLALFGVPSFTVDMGYSNTNLTHVTTVVPVASGGATKFYVFDPTLGGTYRSRKDDSYVDLESALDGSVPTIFKAKPIPRTVMFGSSLIDNFRKAFEQRGMSPRCDLSGDGTYTICKDVPYDVNYLLAGWSEPLRQHSIPLDADLILTFMRKEVFSVSETAGAAPRQEFLAMIERVRTAH